jgi:hypothetical protein
VSFSEGDKCGPRSFDRSSENFAFNKLAVKRLDLPVMPSAYQQHCRQSAEHGKKHV